MRIRLIQKFLSLESSSAIILLLMALIAMLWANSPFAYIHQQFIDASLFWINEGLMAVFFLIVGLELKRGYLDGQLSPLSQIVLPVTAAIGGMLIPAFVYLAINHADPITARGWATPVATDIAFAIGVLSLFGRRVPISLKLFLLVLAIFDDIGAIIIIALFHSHGIVYAWLMMAILLCMVLYICNRCHILSLLPYVLVGCLLWFCLLHSGIHPTIAGVLLALTIPNGHSGKKSPLTAIPVTPLNTLENSLHPWVAYLIMPLFALANAGFSFEGISFRTLTDVVVLGIVMGLFVGKQLGVFCVSWVFIKLKLAKLPEKTNWLMLYGTALLCGIGFTMSLFLGTLSFQNEHRYLAEVRLGVIIGSILSGLVGATVLASAFRGVEGKKRVGSKSI